MGRVRGRLSFATILLGSPSTPLMTPRARRLTVKPLGGSSVFEARMPFRARKKPEPLDEAALYQYAVGALARQMRTVAELKRLMSRRVEPGEAGEAKVAVVVK